MPRARVVLNPLSGHAVSTTELLRLLRPLREAGWETTVVQTDGRGNGTALAREAVREGFDVVVAAGGDGTINEVIQALVGTPVALAVLPLGTGNVWAHEVGIPVDLAGAVRVILDGRVRRVDVGSAGTRYFLLMAGIGYDAEVTGTTDAQAKRKLGRLAYIVRGVTVALSFRGHRATIDVDGKRAQCRALLIVIGNTRRYGGPVSVTAEARIDDGLLDVCVFKGVGALQSARYAAEVLLGRHLRDPGVSYFRAASLTVSSDPPLLVQVDGDTIGKTPMVFRVHTRALNVIVPRQARWHLFGTAGITDRLQGREGERTSDDSHEDRLHNRPRERG